MGNSEWTDNDGTARRSVGRPDIWRKAFCLNQAMTVPGSIEGCHKFRDRQPRPPDRGSPSPIAPLPSLVLSLYPLPSSSSLALLSCSRRRCCCCCQQHKSLDGISKPSAE